MLTTIVFILPYHKLTTCHEERLFYVLSILVLLMYIQSYIAAAFKICEIIRFMRSFEIPKFLWYARRTPFRTARSVDVH